MDQYNRGMIISDNEADTAKGDSAVFGEARPSFDGRCPTNFAGEDCVVAYLHYVVGLGVSGSTNGHGGTLLQSRCQLIDG